MSGNTNFHYNNLLYKIKKYEHKINQLNGHLLGGADENDTTRLSSLTSLMNRLFITTPSQIPQRPQRPSARSSRPSPLPPLPQIVPIMDKYNNVAKQIISMIEPIGSILPESSILLDIYDDMHYNMDKHTYYDFNQIYGVLYDITKELELNTDNFNEKYVIKNIMYYLKRTILYNHKFIKYSNYYNNYDYLMASIRHILESFKCLHLVYRKLDNDLYEILKNLNEMDNPTDETINDMIIYMKTIRRISNGP
jgi:hypothetical protein